MDIINRCVWCGNDPLYTAYHDNEWGIPDHDDRRLFEMLVLEGAQAGLSWLTILKKRENYRKALHGFDPVKVAAYSEHEIQRLLADSGIVRNRLKIEAAIKNARGVLEIKEQYGTLDAFLWRYVDGTPLRNAWKSMAELPAKTARSEAMSKDLKRMGFNFVGSTICYSFMQAVGMVNDHLITCFRHAEITRMADKANQPGKSIFIDPNPPLPRRPLKLPSGQEVKMDMENRLPGVGVGVGDKPET